MQSLSDPHTHTSRLTHKRMDTGTLLSRLVKSLKVKGIDRTLMINCVTKRYKCVSVFMQHASLVRACVRG